MENIFTACSIRWNPADLPDSHDFDWLRAQIMNWVVITNSAAITTSLVIMTGRASIPIRLGITGGDLVLRCGHVPHGRGSSHLLRLDWDVRPDERNRCRPVTGDRVIGWIHGHVRRLLDDATIASAARRWKCPHRSGGGDDR